MKTLKQTDKKPLVIPRELGSLHPSELRLQKSDHIVVIRTEKRSWFTIAITGFGAVILRYIRTVRERSRWLRLWPVVILILVLVLISIRKTGW